MKVVTLDALGRYDKNLFDKFANKMEIVQANDFVIPNAGYSIKNSNIFKQGNHYFGSLVLVKNSGYFDDTGGTRVCSLKENIIGQINSFCALSDTEWGLKMIGYLFLSTNFLIVANNVNPSINCNYAKINIDVVTENSNNINFEEVDKSI